MEKTIMKHNKHSVIMQPDNLITTANQQRGSSVKSTAMQIRKERVRLFALFSTANENKHRFCVKRSMQNRAGRC